MPNFSTHERLVSTPVWVENPTDKPLTWRYDNEYTTFEPGFFRDLNTNEVWCMDVSIAVHFKKSLPELVIHTIRPENDVVLKVKVAKKVEQETPEDGLPVFTTMSMQDLRAYGKEKGKTFRVGITKAELVKELMS